MKENGVNISRRYERNDADSRDIVCVIFMRNDVNTNQLWYLREYKQKWIEWISNAKLVD